MDLRETGWDGGCTVDSVGSGQGAVECSWEHGDGPSGSGAMELVP